MSAPTNDSRLLSAERIEEIRATYRKIRTEWRELAHVCGEKYVDGTEAEVADAVRECDALEVKMDEQLALLDAHVSALSEQVERLTAENRALNESIERACEPTRSMRNHLADTLAALSRSTPRTDV